MLNIYPGNKLGNFIDVLLFLLLLLFGVVFSVLSLALLPFVLLYTIYIMMMAKKG
jgi:hypothetical protein